MATPVKRVIMQCGCVTQATDAGGNPVCVIHYGLMRGATQIMDISPELEGRTARCRDCGREVPSHKNLAFFNYAPQSTDNKDSYYCGCYGWN